MPGSYVAKVAKATTKIDDAVDAIKIINKTDEVIDTTKIVKESIHANSLKSNKINYGYALRDNTTNEILKFGETTRGIKRYSNKFYKETKVKWIF